MTRQNKDLRARRHRLFTSQALANDYQPARCVECGKAVSRINPGDCDCTRAAKELLWKEQWKLGQKPE